MSRYCGVIAERLGLNPETLRTAGWLHDIGMVAITLGPGGLSPADRDELERHPEIGRALLSRSGDKTLDAAAELAWTHHERFDGAGYPRGLAGLEIPLRGRIAAVADTFDALTTDRPYRLAVSFSEAADVLHAERGRQFDPNVVDAFAGALDAVAAIAAHFPPEPVAPVAETLLPLQAAAELLSISPARLRRLADAGRIEAIRTAGGHRRFRIGDVQRLAVEVDGRAGVRPLAPPAQALPALADALRRHGRPLTTAAGAALYHEGPPGWFASSVAAQPLATWVETLASCCEHGRYERALTASATLMERAAGFGASLLERHAFLEAFGQQTARALIHEGATREELAGARRLLTSIQQRLLER